MYELLLTSFFLIKVLTEILPYGDAKDPVISFRIVAGDRPPRSTETRLLPDHIWSMITACWSERPEQRWDIHAIYNQLLASSVQEIAPVEQGNKCVTQIAA